MPWTHAGYPSCSDGIGFEFGSASPNALLNGGAKLRKPGDLATVWLGGTKPARLAMNTWLSSLSMILSKPQESCGCLVAFEIATAQPPSVLALPGAWPLDVGIGTALASWAAVAQWRFCSVHASANQLEPIAIAIWWSFRSTTGLPTALGENRSEVEPPRCPE